MEKDYVKQHDEAYLIAGTRVSLDAVVYAFLEGLSRLWGSCLLPRPP
jgi:hypothetical protein